MSREKFDELIRRYQEGRLSGKLLEAMDSWFDSLQGTEKGIWTEADIERLAQEMNRRVSSISQPVARRGVFRRLLPYAAAVLLTASLAGYFAVISQKSSADRLAARQVNPGDIAPGTNRATLILADGRTIDLSEEQEGIIIQDKITYLDGTHIIENEKVKTENEGPGEEKEAADAPLSAFNSITTPKGGTYQVTLPDGSHVWLNSASTLKYPSRFSESERVILLEGEAFFDINHQPSATGYQAGTGNNLETGSQGPKTKRVPFRVITNGQTIEVLGTEFNVAAYADDHHVTTTLVEGKVKVAAGASGLAVTLSPGELATLSDGGRITRAKANIKKEIAWKSGWFYFDNTSFADMMRQISRWYDVDIQYEDGIPNGVFGGVMDKNVSLKTLLEYLGESGLSFELDNRTLVVRSGSK